MADTPKPAVLRGDTPHPRPEVAERPYGLMGYFTTPKELYHACEAVRDAGYTKFDAHTPFPVHGLEHAMGLPPSKMPWIVLCGGATGFISAVLLTWYTQGYDYPLNVGGKPAFAFTAFVPIMFELTVLFSAFAAFFGMWGLNRLPMHYHPTFKHPSFPRATDDVFFLAIESIDPKYNAKRTKDLLEKLGAQEVMEIEA